MIWGWLIRQMSEQGCSDRDGVKQSQRESKINIFKLHLNKWNGEMCFFIAVYIMLKEISQNANIYLCKLLSPLAERMTKNSRKLHKIVC